MQNVKVKKIIKIIFVFPIVWIANFLFSILFFTTISLYTALILNLIYGILDLLNFAPPYFFAHNYFYDEAWAFINIIKFPLLFMVFIPPMFAINKFKQKDNFKDGLDFSNSTLNILLNPKFYLIFTPISFLYILTFLFFNIGYFKIFLVFAASIILTAFFIPTIAKKFFKKYIETENQPKVVAKSAFVAIILLALSIFIFNGLHKKVFNLIENNLPQSKIETRKQELITNNKKPRRIQAASFENALLEENLQKAYKNYSRFNLYDVIEMNHMLIKSHNFKQVETNLNTIKKTQKYFNFYILPENRTFYRFWTELWRILQDRWLECDTPVTNYYLKMLNENKVLILIEQNKFNEASKLINKNRDLNLYYLIQVKNGKFSEFSEYYTKSNSELQIYFGATYINMLYEQGKYKEVVQYYEKLNKKYCWYDYSVIEILMHSYEKLGNKKMAEICKKKLSNLKLNTI